MYIVSAIKVLELETHRPSNKDNSALRAALKLGIEALKRIVAARAIYEKTNPQLLPGETEE